MTIGIGLIGTGFARTTQAPVFANIDGARIVGVASGKLENAKRVASELSIPHTGDFREIASLPDVDLVVISAPPNLHHSATIAAISSGKHVICEKPMAMNAREAEEMTRAASERPGQLAIIDHELRFNPTRRRLKQMVDDGFLGKLYHVSYTMASGFRHSALRPWNWWAQKSAGGGLLGALGSHAIDSLRWLFGDISSVTSIVSTVIPIRIDPETNQPRQVETDDYCSLLFRFSDSQAFGNVTLSAVYGSGGTNQLTLVGEKGTIILEGDEKLLAAKGFNSSFEDVSVPDSVAKNTAIPSNIWARSFYHLAAATIDALQRGKAVVENAATFHDGLQCQRVIDAIIRANESKKWENVV